MPNDEVVGFLEDIAEQGSALGRSRREQPDEVVGGSARITDDPATDGGPLVHPHQWFTLDTAELVSHRIGVGDGVPVFARLHPGEGREALAEAAETAEPHRVTGI